MSATALALGARCEHVVFSTTTRGFTGPVTRDENRAAHGNICQIDSCDSCGSTRSRNVNGRHVEIGAWVRQ